MRFMLGFVFGLFLCFILIIVAYFQNDEKELTNILYYVILYLVRILTRKREW